MISFKILGFRIEWVGFDKNKEPLDLVVRDLLLHQRRGVAMKMVRKERGFPIRQANEYIDNIARKAGMFVPDKAMDWTWAKSPDAVQEFYEEEDEDDEKEEDSKNYKAL